VLAQSGGDLDRAWASVAAITYTLIRANDPKYWDEGCQTSEYTMAAIIEED
jgi:hypothetical protein